MAFEGLFSIIFGAETIASINTIYPTGYLSLLLAISAVGALKTLPISIHHYAPRASGGPYMMTGYGGKSSVTSISAGYQSKYGSDSTFSNLTIAH